MSVLTVTANTSLERYTFNCRLLHVSAVFGHHQVVYYIHGKEYRGNGLPFAVNTFKYIKVKVIIKYAITHFILAMVRFIIPL
jgi:hypothetical protein